MYKLCKTEQSAQRQRQLEDGLLTMLATKRYEDISISDLCQQMGVPRKSFYRYFSGKDGALHALIDHTLMEFQSFEASFPGEQRTVARDLEKFFLFWQSKKHLLDALRRSDLSGVLIERAVSYSVSDEVFPNRFLSEGDRWIQHHVVMFAVCGLMSMMLQWHQGGFWESVKDMGAVAARVLSQPLFPQNRG